MDPFVAEVRIFPFNFAPKGWAFCNGQLLPISQNTALFSLLGTTYGGDGKSTFALPDLQGAAPMHPGQGPGLSLHDLGETSGSTSVTLLQSEMPFHNHQLRAASDVAETATPSNTTTFALADEGSVYIAGTPANPMAYNSLKETGQSLPHNNMQPYLTCYFNIALQGVFPPRG
ncbi:phage tail protein [Dyadobacter sp. CY347]|uniref:phage tail protein n=1 Tax=Dyadobacter sp. CY347 TaxID=2909336 RepID=UPI001F33B401|nr:tail fiber protein [Dyadobacter sp. CY347]MCF2488580.1 tail fiber protein [Dyadobacter sp. CY347]